MKNRTLLPLVGLSAILSSCATKSGSEDYDVSNPYAAPDYGDANSTPSQPSNVNPAYDAPAVFEDKTPAADTTPAAHHTTAAHSKPAVQTSHATHTTPAPTSHATVHTVVRGDSLWKIAKQYRVPVDSIKKANGMTKDTVVLGAKLNIPAH